MAQQPAQTIRGMFIPLTDTTLLLPGAVIAEVIGYQEPMTLPEPASGRSWLLGMTQWRGLRLPVVSAEALLGGTAAEAGTRARLIVLKALGASPRMPFFAVLAQRIPRLATLTRDTVEPLNDSDAAPSEGDQYVLANGEPAVIPNLEKMAQEVCGAVPE